MSSFTDYLYQMAQQPGYDENGDQAPLQSDALAAVSSQPQASAYNDPSNNPAATAPPPSATGGPVAQPAPVDPDTAAQAAQGITVSAHPAEAPMSAPSFGLPKTAADQGPLPPDDPEADEAPQATPEQIASSKPLQGLLDHKGAFGQTGTLRKILGTLGDAMLVQGGAARQYAPQVQKEKEEDALVGFAQNPSDAIGRLAAIDPDKAISYRAQLTNEGLAGDRIRQTAATAGAKQGIQLGSQGAKLYGNLATAISQAPAGSPLQQSLIAQAQGIKQRYHLDDQAFPDITPQNAPSLGTTYTPTVVQKNAQIAQTATHQGNQDAVAQGNLADHDITAKAAMINAQRPRPGPQPRAVTAQQVVGGLAQKVANGGTLTDAEQKVYDRYAPKQGGGSPMQQFLHPGTTTSANQPHPLTSNGRPPLIQNGNKFDPVTHKFLGKA